MALNPLADVQGVGQSRLPVRLRLSVGSVPAEFRLGSESVPVRWTQTMSEPNRNWTSEPDTNPNWQNFLTSAFLVSNNMAAVHNLGLLPYSLEREPRSSRSDSLCLSRQPERCCSASTSWPYPRTLDRPDFHLVSIHQHYSVLLSWPTSSDLANIAHIWDPTDPTYPSSYYDPNNGSPACEVRIENTVWFSGTWIWNWIDFLLSRRFIGCDLNSALYLCIFEAINIFCVSLCCSWWC